MAMTPQEKAAYGFLGKPPDELLRCSKETVLLWKKLATRATLVAKSSYSQRKVEDAKKIERERNALIELIKREAQCRS